MKCSRIDRSLSLLYICAFLLANTFAAADNSIKAVNLRVEGDAYTAHPFTRSSSIQLIKWDLRDGFQTNALVRVARSPDALYNGGEMVEVATWSPYPELLVSDYPRIGQFIQCPGRYYFAVKPIAAGGAGQWSFDTTYELSCEKYNTPCMSQYGHELPEWRYPDWFVVDETFTGYVWDRTFGPGCLTEWELDADPSPMPWGPGHHHMWGECSGAGEFCIGNNGTLYATAYNARTTTPGNAGCLLASTDGGTDWSRIDINQGSVETFLPRCLAYDSANDAVHLVCQRRGEQSFPMRLYHIKYQDGAFSPAVCISAPSDTATWACQTPSAVFDDRGTMHVVYYTAGRYAGGEAPRLRRAWLPAGSSMWEREEIYLENTTRLAGVIPSIYAAPGALHVFYTEVPKQLGPDGDTAHLGHLVQTLGDPEGSWHIKSPPFDGSACLFGAFHHGVAIEPLCSARGYFLHFIAYDDYASTSIDGGKSLYHNKYDSRTGEWVYEANPDNMTSPKPPFPKIFDVTNYNPAFRIHEYVSLGIDQSGRLAAAFRLRKSPPIPSDRDPYSSTESWLQERDVIAWIANTQSSSGLVNEWIFNPSQVIGDAAGPGLGAYRAFFPMNGRRTNGYLPLLVATAEHYHWGRFYGYSGGHSDYTNPYCFNAHPDPLTGRWTHFYPIFHGMSHRIVDLSSAGSSGTNNELGGFRMPSDMPAFSMSHSAPQPWSREADGNVKIMYSIPEPSEVTISILDLQGRRIATIKDAFQGAGNHEALWEGVDSRGERVAAGLYFCLLMAGEQTASRPVVIVR